MVSIGEFDSVERTRLDVLSYPKSQNLVRMATI